MKRVHVINHMIKAVIIHAPGCRDIARDLRQANNDWTVDVPAGSSVVDAVVADLNDSYGWQPDRGPAPWRASHVRVMPCVRAVD